jgi:hypothetical protein
VVMEYSADEESSAEAKLARDAGKALQGWRPAVLNIPNGARGEGRIRALENVVRWYERACSDTAFTEPAPLEGLDALTDELTEARSHDGLGRLAGVRWAVRVCEELVHWRACRGGDVAPTTAGAASARLELALTGARRQFSAAPPDSLFSVKSDDRRG